LRSQNPRRRSADLGGQSKCTQVSPQHTKARLRQAGQPPRCNDHGQRVEDVPAPGPMPALVAVPVPCPRPGRAGDRHTCASTRSEILTMMPSPLDQLRGARRGWLRARGGPVQASTHPLAVAVAAAAHPGRIAARRWRGGDYRRRAEAAGLEHGPASSSIAGVSTLRLVRHRRQAGPSRCSG
jgi:hypothetical protein